MSVKDANINILLNPKSTSNYKSSTNNQSMKGGSIYNNCVKVNSSPSSSSSSYSSSSSNNYQTNHNHLNSSNFNSNSKWGSNKWSGGTNSTVSLSKSPFSNKSSSFSSSKVNGGTNKFKGGCGNGGLIALAAIVFIAAIICLIIYLVKRRGGLGSCSGSRRPIIPQGNYSPAAIPQGGCQPVATGCGVVEVKHRKHRRHNDYPQMVIPPGLVQGLPIQQQQKLAYDSGYGDDYNNGGGNSGNCSLNLPYSDRYNKNLQTCMDIDKLELDGVRGLDVSTQEFINAMN